MAEEKKMKHSKTQGHHTTTIRHFTDGSHHVKHEHEDGSVKEYAVPNHDAMIDGLMQHTSEPNEGEAEAVAGQGGPGPGALPQPQGEKVA